LILYIINYLDLKTLLSFGITNYRNYKLVDANIDDRICQYGGNTTNTKKIKIKQLQYFDYLINSQFLNLSDIKYIGFSIFWKYRQMLYFIIENDVNARTNGHPGGSTLLLDNINDFEAVKLLTFLMANPNYQTGRDGYHVLSLTSNPDIIAWLFFYINIYLTDYDSGKSGEDYLRENPQLCYDILQRLLPDINIDINIDIDIDNAFDTLINIYQNIYIPYY
jgi:hypothetical protein